MLIYFYVILYVGLLDLPLIEKGILKFLIGVDLSVFLWLFNYIYLDLSQHLDNLKLLNYVVTSLLLMMLLKHKADLPDTQIYVFTYIYM